MSHLFAHRISLEVASVREAFGEAFTYVEQPYPGLTGPLRTSRAHDYVVFLGLRAYPAQPPETYVVFPRLVMRSGRRIRAPNHSLHVNGHDAFGHPRICLHHPLTWSPATTLASVLVKTIVWLEGWDTYRVTGRPVRELLRPMDAIP